MTLLVAANFAFFTIFVRFTGRQLGFFSVTTTIIVGVGIGVATRTFALGAGLACFAFLTVSARFATVVRTIGHYQSCK